MGTKAKIQAIRRPVVLARYGTPRVLRPTEAGSEPVPAPASPAEPRLRHHFPVTAGSYRGGNYDGYRFRIVFAGGRFAYSYGMVREFLVAEGYGDLPLPATVEELLAFRLPPRLRHQLSLFGEDGYVHNPIKVLFPPPGGKRGALVLEIHNESAPGHLLRFHRRGAD